MKLSGQNRLLSFMFIVVATALLPVALWAHPTNLDSTLYQLRGGKPGQVSLSPNGQHLAYLDKSGYLRVCRTDNPSVDTAQVLLPNFASMSNLLPHSMRVSDDGQFVAFVDPRNSQAIVVQMNTKSIQPLSDDHVLTLALSHDGRYVATKNARLGLTLHRTSTGDFIPLIKSDINDPILDRAIVGSLTFVGASVRELIDAATPRHQRPGRFINIHKAEYFEEGLEIPSEITEIVRAQRLPFPMTYPSRELQISNDRQWLLSSGHSIVEIWNSKTPLSPLTLAVPAGTTDRTRFAPVKAAALSPNGAFFAVVYQKGILLMDSHGGNIFGQYLMSDPKETSNNTVARFDDKNNLIIARSDVQKPLMRLPIPLQTCRDFLSTHAP